MRERAWRWAPWIGAVALVGAALALAGARSLRGDLACAPGLGPQQTRCCAPGQTEAHGRCVGAARSCPAPLELVAQSCVAPPVVVDVPATRLASPGPDWEAAGQPPRPSVDVAAFRIDAFEVSVARWSECQRAGRCAPLSDAGEPGRPVAGVDVDAAAAFCEWAGGALPTATQFEAAAMGPRAHRYPWGPTGAVCRRAAWGRSRGPCAHGASGPELTGAFPDGATELGVYDLAGNVAEWVRSADGLSYEARGGSFRDEAAAALRTWSARPTSPGAVGPDLGFRCVYPPAKSNDTLPGPAGRGAAPRP